MSAPALPRLSLGPVLYYWPRQQLLDFYARMADAPVDIIYLGETVCSKRRALRWDDWLGLARELRAAGKEVVLSTLTLIEAESELGYVERLCAQEEFPVEANDLSAVQLRGGRAFVTGPAEPLTHFRTNALGGLPRPRRPAPPGIPRLRFRRHRRAARRGPRRAQGHRTH